MARVVRARLCRHPLAVSVPEQAGLAGFRLSAGAGQDEDMLLWEVQTRCADALGELPEALVLVVFWDASLVTAEA